MAYATKQDMIDRFGEDEITALTDWAGSVILSDVVITTALDASSAVVDFYISGACQTPVDVPQNVIKEITCDITIFKISKKLRDQSTYQIKYLEAMKMLKMIQEGQKSPLAQPSVGVQFLETTPFAKEELSGW